MTTSEVKLSMKLLIDTKARKVLFAEAEKDFVDFLFHILSLPVGTATRLLKKEGMNGCLANLYDSVESLSDTYYINSNQAKDILIKSDYSSSCREGLCSVPFLLLNDDPTIPAQYACPCSCYYTKNPTTLCQRMNCGNRMSSMCKLIFKPTYAVAAYGGYVKDKVTYTVTDDLVVKPMSNISSITLLNKFDVKDVSVLQEKVVNFGTEEALKLLKASFESKSVLTSVFMSCMKVEK